jgi:hypothetical protein
MYCSLKFTKDSNGKEPSCWIFPGFRMKDLINVVLEAVVTEGIKANEKSFQAQGTMRPSETAQQENNVPLHFVGVLHFSVDPLATCAT